MHQINDFHKQMFIRFEGFAFLRLSIPNRPIGLWDGWFDGGGDWDCETGMMKFEKILIYDWNYNINWSYS